MPTFSLYLDWLTEDVLLAMGGDREESLECYGNAGERG